MELNKTQIRILNEIYLYKLNSLEIGKKLKLSNLTISRNIKKLKEYNLIDSNNQIPNTLFSKLLENILSKQLNLIFLQKTNFKILLELLNKEKNIGELIINLNIEKTQIYDSLKKLKNQSIVIKKNDEYSINSKLWFDLIEFLIIYKTSNEYLNNQLPMGSKVLFKKKNKTIFENKNELNDFQKTAFSVFDFNLFYNTNIYTNKKELLTKEEIYEDALNIASSQRELLFCGIYYLKHKFKYIKNSKHDKIIKILLENKKFKGFPTKKDILIKQEND